MRLRALPGILALASLGALGACASTPAPPATGLVLPHGNPDSGRQAFLELQCHACHEVKGGGFPGPTIYPPLPFVLGERWDGPPDRAWLATSIADPGHEILPGNVVAFHGGGQVYRMKDYGESMTVGQLCDLVEFLATLDERGPGEPE